MSNAPLTDDELSAIGVHCATELRGAKYKSITLAKLLHSDIPRLVAELRDVRARLAVRTLQCERLRQIVDGDTVGTT